MRRPTATDRPPLEWIELDHVSRWYGNVVAVNDVTLRASAPASPDCSGPTAPARPRCCT